MIIAYVYAYMCTRVLDSSQASAKQVEILDILLDALRLDDHDVETVAESLSSQSTPSKAKGSQDSPTIQKIVESDSDISGEEHFLQKIIDGDESEFEFEQTPPKPDRNVQISV